MPGLGRPLADDARSDTATNAVDAIDMTGATPVTHLIITAGSRWFALAGAQVDEIVDDPHVLKVPRTGPGFAGYALLRGALVPLTDLSALFDRLLLEKVAADPMREQSVSGARATTADLVDAAAQVLVLKSSARQTGLLVSEVMGVCDSGHIIASTVTAENEPGTGASAMAGDVVASVAADVSGSTAGADATVASAAATAADRSPVSLPGLPTGVVQCLRIEDVSTFPGATACIAAGYRNQQGGIDLPLLDATLLICCDAFINAAVDVADVAEFALPVEQASAPENG